ncbi:hypothetical protein AcV7_008751 [Taiwanofungus camphoratus]|nr:hypothetical protein AcV7_008751 [Antrodia cinnamomea]
MEERERPGSPVCDDMRLERQGCRAASAMYSVAFPALSHSYSPRPTLGMLHGPHPPTSSPSPFSPSNLRSRARAGGGCKYPASPTRLDSRVPLHGERCTIGLPHLLRGI